MHALIQFIVETVDHWGYFGIIVAMTLESSFFPFPSEVIMIPAGYLSHRGDMNLVVAILCGVFGSMIGAYFNYYISIKLGRPLLLKLGRYVGISEKKFNKVDRFFYNHGEITTFVGRLIPGVRQVISCPAGLARMNILRFSIYTGAGAGIWVIILAMLGYFIGKNEVLLKQYSRQITILLLIFCAFIVAIYIYVKTRKARREEMTDN